MRVHQFRLRLILCSPLNRKNEMKKSIKMIILIIIAVVLIIMTLNETKSWLNIY